MVSPHLITFLLTNDWLINHFMCFKRIQSEHLSDDVLDIYTNEDISSLFPLDFNTVFISNGSYGRKYYRSLNLIIYRNLSDFSQRNIFGRAVLITEQLDSAALLWKNSKVSELIVLVKLQLEINAYTWYPYSEKQCKKGVPNLELISTCKNGYWHKIPNFPVLPNNFQQCPLQTTVGRCYGFFYETVPTVLGGIEHVLIYALAKNLNFKISFVEPENESFFTHFRSNGDIGGGTRLLWEQKADIAAGCMGIVGNRYKFIDILPPHYFDSLSWFVPTPKLKPNYESIYAGFSPSLWGVILISYFAFVLALFLISKVYNNTLYKSATICLINTLSNLIGFGTALSFGLIQYVLSLLNFFSIHLLAFYQSTLLTLLFRPSFEDPISTALEGIQLGLAPIVRFIYKQYLDYTDEPLIAAVKAHPGLQVSVDAYLNYTGLLFSKTHMLLGLKFVDECVIALIFKDYHVSELVDVIKPPHQNYPYSLYISPGNPLKEILGRKIYQLSEGGLVDFWADNTSYHISKVMAGKRALMESAISFDSLQSGFYILLLGIAISCVIFISEFCQLLKSRNCKKNQNSLRVINKRLSKHISMLTK